MTLPQPDDDFDDVDLASENDEIISHAIASHDHNDRWYYQNRNGRFWMREYEKAGCA